MKLKDKLQSAEILYFADPIHYAGPHYPNRQSVILKSDFDFFKPYLKHWGKPNSQHNAEIRELDPRLANQIRLFDGNYSLIVPDNILKNKKKLHAFFCAEDFLAGPQVNYSSGKYVGFDGDDSMRLDIFGDKVGVADFRYFSSNRLYINGVLCNMRNLTLQAEDEGIFENISVFENKTRYLMIADYEENYEDADSARYFCGGEIDYENGIIFVDDLEDNDEVEAAVMEWHDSYMSNQVESNWKYEEDCRFSAVKYKNAIVISHNDF